MTLAIVTAHPELHAPRRLAAAAAALSVPLVLVPPVPWFGAASSGSAGAETAAAAARISAGTSFVSRPGPFRLVEILRTHRRLACAGATPLQSRRALLDACDQWRSLRRLARAGVATPRSELVRRPEELPRALAAVAGPPWYLKGRRGSQGSQVVLAETVEAARRAAHLFWGTGASFLVQEDLRATGDVERHLVVADEVVAAARARPVAGEHRTNAHRGGRFEAIDPASSRAAPLAVRATEAISLPFAAIDTIGAAAPVVLDVNASPGLEALEAATGRDLARVIVLSIVARAER